MKEASKFGAADFAIAIEAIRSLIEDIKKDGTRVVFREKDGSEQDITKEIMPVLQYAHDGLVYSSTETKLLK